MIRNYFKTAWRNLWKNKAFSVINILGLALGLACSLLIFLWVQDETQMDAFHANGKQIYVIIHRAYFDHKSAAGYSTPGVLAEELKKEIPEVINATQFSWNQDHTFQVRDKILKVNGTYASPDYFKMFSFHLLQGKPASALNSPTSLAISKKMADNFFGSPERAIGKTIKYENQKNFTVTAVFDDQPKNSSLQYEFIVNWYTFLDENSWAKDWGNNGPMAFFQIRKDASPALVDKKLTHFLDNLDKGQQKGKFYSELGMQPFLERYLHDHFTGDKVDGGRIGYVHLFSVIAIFILLIACINFMNLTTARSLKRAREIGVRKVVGAMRPTLIRQFLGESLLLTSIAVLFSLILMALLLPVFNQITGKQISLPFDQPAFWLELLGLTLITGIVAGSYPALFLSSFKPVKVLKGAVKMTSGVVIFRKGLVVFQFVLSVVLIISTIIITRQVNYVENQNLGYDRENLIYIPLEGDLAGKYDLFKNELLKMDGIQEVTRTTDVPTNIQNSTGGVDWDGKDPNINIQFTQASVGYNFVRTLKLKLLQGRDFSKDFGTDSAGYLVNEAALKRIGYKDPVGKRLTFWGKKGTIIGVLKDYHIASLQQAIVPLILRLSEKESWGNALIRTKPGQTKLALASMEKLCKQLNPNFQFSYYFSDEQYQKLYNNEQVVSKLSNVFASLAIIISCLGLLGLAMFTAEQRVKEIGIRKVLGAGLGSLFSLLSSEFLILVGIALLIASPLAWYGMNKWLQNYAYHTSVEWWFFALAAIIALLITVVTISFQTIKAALVNPVKSLRSE
ncbi:MAG: macB 22 [Mucilaginibacter sp.]|nr:macB 22 [Mucilaginibacter sp.]